jgi:kinesin family protein 5
LKKDLEVREHKTKGVYIEDLTWEYVSCTNDILALLALGDANKVRRATKMNPSSSRSHCNFCIRAEKKDTQTNRVTENDFNLVDLAGSERIAKSGASEGTALEELKKINLSLTALAQCINALTQGAAAAFVPFRQSKLTRILQDSLGGNAKTTMLVACSPHPDNADETLGSLRFAQRCANVTNKAKVNVQLSVEELTEMIDALRADLERVKRSKGYVCPDMTDSCTQCEEEEGAETITNLDTLMEKQVCKVFFNFFKSAQNNTTADMWYLAG